MKKQVIYNCTIYKRKNRKITWLSSNPLSTSGPSAEYWSLELDSGELAILLLAPLLLHSVKLTSDYSEENKGYKQLLSSKLTSPSAATIYSFKIKSLLFKKEKKGKCSALTFRLWDTYLYRLEAKSFPCQQI